MLDLFKELFGNDWIGVALFIVAVLIITLCIFSFVVEIILTIKYIRYNHKKNSAGLNGEEVAREILDNNGCKDVKIKCVGSLIWGNSYSHTFKKVRLRRLTIKKKSLTSLAMGAQKSCLAVLDKEGDKDMKRRNVLIPLQMFGPFAFIPLVLVGVVIDLIIFAKNGQMPCTVILSIIGFLFYFVSLFLQITFLKVEKKGQKKALEILKKDGLATDEEIEDCKALFKLYNIEYINNIILEILEIIYRVLQIAAQLSNNSSSSKSKN